MKNKKIPKDTPNGTDEMLPEYDFSGGVRGKHHKAYREGHTVTVHKGNDGVQIQHFKLEDGAVLLENDVRKYFPDSESVNSTLRGLITLLPRKPRQKTHS